MALPVGVTTATITFGVPVSFTGGAVRSTVSIVPSASLVHTATGTPLVNFIEDVITSEGVSGQFTLPHTDQLGFQDESGNSYQNWYYTATISYSAGKTTLPPRTKTFQLPTGQTTVDLDLLPAGAPVLPWTAATANVTSFHGRIGAVTVQDSDLPARLQDAALDAEYVGKGSLAYNVKDYGALGNASQDDTTFIQAAIDAASVSGGEVFFPAGKYKVTATLTVTKSITLRGIAAGSTSETQGTTLYTSGAITMFTSNANRVNFRDLNLSCYAGAGAVTPTTIGIDFTDGDFCTVERCTVQNFYINIWFRSCGWWNLLYNYINNPAKYGVLVQNTGQGDTGDQVMIGNFFNCDGVTWNPDALVRQESGGGVKVTANKFYKGKVGYQIAVADGVNTSIVPTTGNSFEFQTVYCIQVTQSGTGTGTFRRININANQFTALTAAATIRIDPLAGSIPIDEVVISGNVMAGTAGLTEHIYVDRVNNLSITGNSFNVGLTGIKIGGNSSNIHTSGNKFRSIGTALSNATAAYYASNDLVEVDQVKTFDMTSTTVPNSLHQINVSELSGCLIDVLIFGTVRSGISGFTARFQRLATRGVTGSAVTLTTIGTDSTGGAPIVVTFDTSTAGIVVVKIQRSASDGGTSILGNSIIKVKGAASALA